VDADQASPVPPPAQPASPPEPAGSSEAAAPVAAAEKVEPADPVEPAAPVEPAEPVEPAAPEPAAPEPADPAEPAVPVESAALPEPVEAPVPTEVAAPPRPVAPVDLVELALASVELSPDGLLPATGTVRLVDLAAGGQLDIVMARADAVLVQEAISGVPPARPRTHDLLLAVIAALSGAVTEVALVERRPGGVYVASLKVLRPNGVVAELDARPSDALNVALRSPGAALRAARSLVDVPAN